MPILIVSPGLMTAQPNCSVSHEDGLLDADDAHADSNILVMSRNAKIENNLFDIFFLLGNS
jgi:hypothetical protein